MNIYRAMGYQRESADAIDLADRLALWHDAMVAHERTARRGNACEDECPHADARALWDEAVRTFGARAAELRFLHAAATHVRRRAAHR